MNSRETLYHHLTAALEIANNADSEGCDLAPECCRMDNVYGDIRRALERINPGCVSEWSLNGEWPGLAP